MLIFVYGSLRKGEYNHPYAKMDKLVFVGVEKTKPVYTLKDFGSYPGLYVDGTTSVVGEIYRVDEGSAEQVEILSRIEGMEVGAGYERKVILLDDAGFVEPVFGWVKKPQYDSLAKVVEGGDWVVHNAAKEAAYWATAAAAAAAKRRGSRRKED